MIQQQEILGPDANKNTALEMVRAGHRSDNN
jgi:hypothetical protein